MSSHKEGRVRNGACDLWLTAASVLSRVLRNGSLKSILAPMRGDQARQINALVTETLKRREVLEKAVTACGPWRLDAKDAHELRLLLAHELLFGRGLRQAAFQKPSDNAVLSDAIERFRSWETGMLKLAKQSARDAGTTPAAMAAAEEAEAAEASAVELAQQLPRYVRVNTLKVSVADVVALLQAEGWKLMEPPEGVGVGGGGGGGGGGSGGGGSGGHKKRKHLFADAQAVGPRIGIATAPPPPACFWVDPHVPALLALPPHAELHEHSLFKSDALILQDKASCLAPAALNPKAGELILDCCAAPGNKTTQLAALAAPGGRVLACERDARRATVLRARAERAAGDAVSVHEVDFLELDPTLDPYRRVTSVQLDPTCSGSGMVERAGYQLSEEAPEEAHKGGFGEKLKALGAMQLGLLKHAMTFPSAGVVVYSTCSVHPVEDELVVAAALADPAVRAAGWRLAPALPSWPCRGLPLVEGHEMLVRAGPEVQANGFFVARFERTLKPPAAGGGGAGGGGAGGGGGGKPAANKGKRPRQT